MSAVDDDDDEYDAHHDSGEPLRSLDARRRGVSGQMLQAIGSDDLARGGGARDRLHKRCQRQIAIRDQCARIDSRCTPHQNNINKGGAQKSIR